MSDQTNKKQTTEKTTTKKKPSRPSTSNSRDNDSDTVTAMAVPPDSTPSTRTAMPSMRLFSSAHRSASQSHASSASTDRTNMIRGSSSTTSVVNSVQVPAISSTRTAVPTLKPVSSRGGGVVKAPAPKAREKKYVVVFPFQTTEKKYLAGAQKGDKVTAERWVAANQITNFEMPVVSDKNNKIGMVPPFYLMTLNEWKKPNLIQSGRWFVGQIGPVEASVLLERGSEKARKGWFVVCEPPEYCSDSARWPELLMLVRTYNGSEKRFAKLWKNDQQSSEKAPPTDNLPTVNKEPLPVIVYVRIRRKADGRYYIVNEPAAEPSYSLMDVIGLLYQMDQLPINAEVTIKPDQLAIPPSLMPTSDSATEMVMDSPEPPFIYGPRPLRRGRRSENLIFVDKGFDLGKIRLEEKMGDHGPHSLGLTYLAAVPAPKPQPSTSKTRTSTRSTAKSTKTDTTRTERTFRQVISSGLKSTKVHLGLDQKTDQRRPTFDPQLGIMVSPTLKESKNICAKRIKEVYVFPGLIRQLEYLRRFRHSTSRGHNYLAKLFGYREDTARHILTIFSEWAGQCPLDCVLGERNDKKVPLATRGCLEVCYQVAAGMRFLEANELFHGQLATCNIQAKRDMYGSMTIKLTDYYIYAKVLSTEPNLFAKVCSQKTPKLQWRCLAPEVLHGGKFTIKGDVWSFGIVMCEVFGHGKKQFLQFNDPKALFKAFDDNKLSLKTSQSWPAYILTLLKQCCRKGTDNRPTFADIWAFFNDLLFDAVNGPLAVGETLGGILKALHTLFRNSNHTLQRGFELALSKPWAPRASPLERPRDDADTYRPNFTRKQSADEEDRTVKMDSAIFDNPNDDGSEAKSLKRKAETFVEDGENEKEQENDERKDDQKGGKEEKEMINKEDQETKTTDSGPSSPETKSNDNRKDGETNEGQKKKNSDDSTSNDDEEDDSDEEESGKQTNAQM